MAMESATAPCPHCKAENMSHRRACWRCKRTLPTSFALDAQLRMARTRLAPLESEPPTREEIQTALNQAVIIGGQYDEEEQFPQGSGVFGKRLLWLLGRRRLA